MVKSSRQNDRNLFITFLTLFIVFFIVSVLILLGWMNIIPFTKAQRIERKINQKIKDNVKHLEMTKDEVMDPEKEIPWNVENDQEKMRNVILLQTSWQTLQLLKGFRPIQKDYNSDLDKVNKAVDEMKSDSLIEIKINEAHGKQFTKRK